MAASLKRLTDRSQTGNVALTSSIIQYAIFLATTGIILPVIDRISRRWLLIVGAIICGIIHFVTGAIMAVYGHKVDSVDGMHLPITHVLYHLGSLALDFDPILTSVHR